MKITVVGCGKMGLPLAVQAASQGICVTGLDTNRAVVDAINRGVCPIEEPSIKRHLRKLVKTGALRASIDLEKAVADSDAVIVIVPVLLNKRKEADLSNAVAVSRSISGVLRKGMVVSFEMTLPVGTTRNVLAPILEHSGLKVEKDFYLVFSPERVKSTTVMEQMQRVPKIVGGFGPKSAEEGIRLYKKIFTSKIINVETLENAEMVKLAGMVYRDVNIALVNEIARYCDTIGVDLTSLIPVINTDGEANLLLPGIGVGGHCTPIYPYFLIHEARRRGSVQRLAISARKINDSQAAYVVCRLKTTLGNIKGLNILILGLGFRPNVKEDTKSPAYLLKEALEHLGGRVSLYDPLYSGDELRRKGFRKGRLYGRGRMDAVILNTAHKEFLNLNWQSLKRKGIKVFVDGRNSFIPEEIEGHGIVYIGIGKGFGHRCQK